MNDVKRLGKLTGFPAVALVAVGAAVAQSFGRFTYGVLLPAVRDDLGISNTVAGSIGTLNVGAYLIGTIAVALATAKHRLLDVMRVGFLFSTAGLIMAAVSPGPLVLGLAMVLTGFGGACIWIPAPVIAADALAPQRRALAVGLMGSGIGVGILFSGQLSGYVRSTLGDQSWRTVYVVEASIAVVVLVATLLFIGHSQARPTAGRPGIGGFSVLRRMPGWIALTLAYTSFGFMYLLVIAFLTTRLEDDSNWTGPRASLAFTALGLAVIFGGPALIGLARRIGPRLSMALAFTTWSGLAILVLPGWFGPTLGASVGLGLLFGGIPTLITLYVVENTSVEDYGPSFAAATLAFGVAQMLSPQIGGLIADLTGSFTPVFVLSSGFALTGTIAALQLPRPGRMTGAGRDTGSA
ncbi:MAG: MFS transporter [Acidimicrobiales bacterium]